MVDDPKMVSIQDSEPVIRSEFRTAMAEVKEMIGETRRHMGVLHKDLLHKFDLVFEYLTPFGERVTRHEERLDTIETDIDLLKTLARSRR